MRSVDVDVTQMVVVTSSEGVGVATTGETFCVDVVAAGEAFCVVDLGILLEEEEEEDDDDDACFSFLVT